MDIAEIFTRFEREHGEFEKVKLKRSSRKDLHGFLLLDQLVPKGFDLVSSAEHDIIYFDVSPEDLSKVATEDNILELIHCGIFIDSESGCLAKYV